MSWRTGDCTGCDWSRDESAPTNPRPNGPGPLGVRDLLGHLERDQDDRNACREFRLSERERWAIVAFLKGSSPVTPAEYQVQRDRLQLAGVGGTTSHNSEASWQPEGAVQRGRIAIQQYACPTCHVIPGIRGPDAQVGPPLGGIAEQIYLAGVLLNTPTHMIEWLRSPQKVKPLSAMPNLGVTERDARDIAAYLDALR